MHYFGLWHLIKNSRQFLLVVLITMLEMFHWCDFYCFIRHEESDCDIAMSCLTEVQLAVFLNWLRISCVVSITTAATWHIRIADFCAAFKQHIVDIRQSNKQVVKRFWTYVKAEKLHFEQVITLTYPNAPAEALFKRFDFSVHKAAWTVEWSALKDCYDNRFHLVHCCKNCLLTLRFN